MKRLSSTVMLLALIAGLCGCEGKKCSISGTVTRGGEKLTWPNEGTLLVIFVPENRSRNDNVYAAETDIATSSFTIASIPAGRYQVAVQQFNAKWMDSLGGAYDLGKSKLFYEVTDDSQVIEIDLPKE